jgi:lipoprotein-anchoring transpeptidase ErfK/SrfK
MSGQLFESHRRSCRSSRLAAKALKLIQRLALLLVAVACSSCSTVSDMVVTHIPKRQSGRPSVVVSLSEQKAYLYQGKHLTASSRISSGREGHRTPTGRFRVIRKHEDHRSSLYGDYVDRESGRVVRANVDVRKHRKPRGTRYVGAAMPFYVEFSPSYGLHAGYLPGVPASHGCIRMPYWKARQFYRETRIGTPVVVRP